MTDEPRVERATFITRAGEGDRIPIHFNPVSLQYAITNTLQEHGQDKKQYVTKSTAKLTMQLIFDTTHDGSDVRIHTQKIAKFMEPTSEVARGKKAPEVVMFDWGTYRFRGMVESYKETIDFFAPAGVPLRATIDITLTRQEKVFEDERNAARNPEPEPAVTLPVAGETMTDVAARGGNPTAARSIAAANNQESMRFPSGAIALSGSLSLGPPVAFATGSVGFGVGISGGIGIGASAGIGVGASAGIGGSIGAGASAGIGIQASAGVSASGGAFAGLRTTRQNQRFRNRIDTSRFLQQRESFNYATGKSARFQVGGQAAISSASLSADVGVSASVNSRIQFEG